MTMTIQPLRATAQIFSNPDFQAVFCISLLGLLGTFALILSGVDPAALGRLTTEAHKFKSGLPSCALSWSTS
jgi:hypothetical protein